MASFRQTGGGRVPASPLLSAAWKEFVEIPAVVSMKAVAPELGKQIDFTVPGLSYSDFKTFFEEALDAAKKIEPIVETGNKYGVSTDFHKMNGEILMEQARSSGQYKALSEKDRQRAEQFLNLVSYNKDLRNRNPLHPTPLDSAVLGNLVNFPKHIFGFPCGGYATNGFESLSLCLYSYRQECSSKSPVLLYALGAVEEDVFLEVAQACADRLGLEFVAKPLTALSSIPQARVAVVMSGFTNPELGTVAKWAEGARLHMHVHVTDVQFRDILVQNVQPVHFNLPACIRSMSVHEGIFNTGFQLYRDPRLRDLHFDLPYAWQTAYMSPNEGGSGNSTPLFLDFCFAMLGWSALRDIASKGPFESNSMPLQPLRCGPLEGPLPFDVPQGPEHFDAILDWAKSSMHIPRDDLERHLVSFQRAFVGGESREVEAIVTSGGTRSINFSFESVMVRARNELGRGVLPKVITGNPHLAVERAERRFQFELVRVAKEGVLCMDGLRRELRDPTAVAVYAQTLSFTDGISDPLAQILEAIEEENKRREASGKCLVTLINDSCLAFSVLIHNDGKNGNKNFRVMDLSMGHVTPTIVMLDAHKHLGADKGISMTMGTPGTLSHLSGHLRVGAAPCRGELVRAIADLSLVGVNGYYEKYDVLAGAIADMLKEWEAAGMTVIHGKHRVKGSTVFSIEDPSAVVGKHLKQKGHVSAPIYEVYPDAPDRCQTGFQFSLTPHTLRVVKDGKSALEMLRDDVSEVFKAASGSYPAIAKLFKENSLPGFLLAGGNEEIWSFPLLHHPGPGREITSLLLRRLYSAILDSGSACSDKRKAPLRDVSASGVAMVTFLAVMMLPRRMARRSKL